MEVGASHHRGDPDQRKAVLTVRPHVLEIVLTANGGREFPATVRSINPAGPQVKVELITAWGDPMQVDMRLERFRALNLAPGKEVFVRPKEEKLLIYHI